MDKRDLIMFSPSASEPTFYFNFLQWNTLSSRLCGDDFPHIQDRSSVLDWTNRQKHLIAEIEKWNPDVFTLEEVDEKDYNEMWSREMDNRGWTKSVYLPKSPGGDGTCVFWKDTRFEGIRTKAIRLNNKGEEDDQETHGRVAILIHARPREKEWKEKIDFYFVGTHLKAKVGFEETRVIEGSILLESLATFMKEDKSKREKVIVIGGDFNDVPGSDVYNLFQSPTDKLGNDFPIKSLTSAYTLYPQKLIEEEETTTKEEPYTTFKKRDSVVRRCIDYIWISSNVEILDLLEIPKFTDLPSVGLPSTTYPSDHLAIMTGIEYKPIVPRMNHVYVLEYDNNGGIEKIFGNKKAMENYFVKVAKRDLPQELKECKVAMKDKKKWTKLVKIENKKRKIDREYPPEGWDMSCTPPMVEKLDELIKKAEKSGKNEDWLTAYDYVADYDDMNAMFDADLSSRKNVGRYKVKNE